MTQKTNKLNPKALQPTNTAGEKTERKGSQDSKNKTPKLIEKNTPGSKTRKKISAGTANKHVRPKSAAELQKLKKTLQQQDSEIHRVNRALRTISECNQVLIYSTDEPALLNEVCRLIVETGGYRMAWVGMAEMDDAKSVHPAAHYGFDSGYLKDARISWADTELGHGPTGTAIREGKVQVNQNFMTNKNMIPWRKRALERGYQSSIALPLKDGQSVFGALTIYALAPDAFDVEETHLLTELAGDLSYGITALRERKKRKQAEEEIALQASEWSNTFDAISEMISIHSPDFKLVRVNKSVEKFLGKKAEELIGKKCYEVFHGLKKPWPNCPNVKALKLKQPVSGEVIDPNLGCPLLISISPLFDKEGRVVGTVHIAKDITEQKRTEIMLREMSLFPALNPDAVVQVNADGCLEKVNPAAEKSGLAAGRNLAELIPDLSDLNLSSHIEDGKIVEVREARLGGRILNWTVSGAPELGRVFLYSKDITERKEAEKTLQSASLYARSLLEASLDPLATISLDGRITDVNHATELVTGISREILIGDDVSNYFTEPEKAREGYQKVLSDGLVRDYPLTIRHVSGKTTDVIYNATIYKNEDGEIQGVFAAARDITELKRAELALKQANESLEKRVAERTRQLAETESRFRLALKNAPVTVAVQDLDLRFTWAYNQRTRQPDEIIGNTDADIFPPEVASQLIALKRKVLETGVELSQQLWVESNGQKLYLDLFLEPLKDEAGNITGLGVATVNLTNSKESEDALRLSESELKHAQEVARIGSWKWNIEKGEITWSDEMYRIFGLDKISYTGRLGDAISKVIHPDDLHHVLPSNAPSLTEGKPIEYRIILPDKSIRNIWAKSGEAITDANGKPIYLTGIAQDITERKQIEEALARSNSKLSEVLDSIQDDFYVLDRDWNFVFASRQFTLKIGKEPKDLIGNNIWELFPKHIGTAFEENLRASMEMGEIRRFEVGGKYTKAWYSMRSFPTTEGVTVLGTDITERKRLEDALRLSHDELEKRVQSRTMELEEANKVLRDEIIERRRVEQVLHLQSAALESAANSIMITNVNGDIQWVNPAWEQLTGYSSAEVVGKNPRILNSGKQNNSFYNNLWSTIQSGHVWHGEIINRRKNGRLYIGEETITPVYDSNEGIINYVAIKQNITERKRAEEKIRRLNRELEKRVLERTAKLEAANKELETFSYSVSHDLRTPLRAISMFADIISQQHNTNLTPEGQHFVENIILASARMERLIDDLLRYSRLGRKGLTFENIPLSDILPDIVHDLKAALVNTQGTILLDDNLPIVTADRTLLTQIFTNLLENAIKYSKANIPPRIEVTWQAEGKEVVIKVRDNGIGIPAKFFENIFDVFRRLHAEDQYDGTGIGLATVKKSAKLLGGNVWVESQVGEGSVFLVRLPKGA
ncbi:MAG: PAS domain S-box protein [Chloroflexi bacterium]|nr:PAS domain S-box protein [Chloroflexota bacterium]